ncbi:ABC transporter ATP-binding protein [Carnobacteriaceae bacterium zg-84]|uniref:ABC transporter ATP-binding protein n=1 Tax=Granulicatella sp. zg-84 TaxID=2678503 RepID=UPI0013C24BAE|nr:ABC transporter ATP-binding protein [Granulicatella sp. zg-84]NEW65875.1 ATP-binding cassette domain-containing protein [Granulicatella sp. zg-84]QMI86412.1 ABC transporter ATP-binding protein [Carnobacteriaceae bacterium zg-84]
MENKEKERLFVQMAPYVKGFKIPFIVAVIGAVIASTITVIGPDRVSEITNEIAKGIVTGIDMDKVSSIAMSLGILYVISAVLSYMQGVIVATMTQKLTNRLRRAISVKLDKVPLKYFDSHVQGDTLSRVTNDVDTLGQSLSQSLGGLLSSVVLLFGSIFMMMKTNVLMALTAIFTVVLGLVGVIFLMSKSRGLFYQQQKNLAAVSGYAEEMYSGHHVVTSYNGLSQTKETFESLNDALYQSIWKSQFLSGIMMPLMIFLGNFGYVMVCVVGAILTLNGDITFGVVVAFMLYVRIFSQPLSQIAQSLNVLQSGRAAMSRVFEFLSEPEMADETDKINQLDNVKGHVVFEHVSFGYDKEKTIIHDFSAIATVGQKVAIVGPTGAGKTTIVNLLMKFYEIDSGSIQIDGVDIKDMTREAVHDLFSMVLQDTWLFEGTIKENLIYNQENITDEQVKQACQAVGVHHFIKTLPKGYDTYLDDSISLSVGQKQLLTIARALLKNAPLLILDEATSSVDTRTEELIQKAMDKLMEGRTSFVIAHRLSTIKNADLILVMKDGNIIEQGNHDVLMAQGGFYADLYNSQFENE